MKIAFVFPGQGSQYVGMGKDLYDNFEEARNLYNEASESLGYDVAELSFNGPKSEMNRTFRTQPLLLTASIAAHAVLTQKGITPEYVAGHSLGEYSAVVAAGVIPFGDAVRLTEKRGQAMQDAVPEGKGLMAAIIGLERDEIRNLCESVKSGYVAPANYNCPGQTVIAGETPAVEEAVKLASEAGAKRAVPLAVSVPSHCKLMESASNKLSGLLDNIELRSAAIPLINNADAKVLTDGQEIRNSLVSQLDNPLLWEDSIKKMVENGVDTIVEVGPKKVLGGLIKRINGDLKILNAEDTESIEAVLKELQ